MSFETIVLYILRFFKGAFKVDDIRAMTLKQFDSLCLSVLKISQIESGDKENEQGYSKTADIERAIENDPAIRRIKR